MRRTKPGIGLKPAGYRQLAWLALGCALVVAMFGTDSAPAPAKPLTAPVLAEHTAPRPAPASPSIVAAEPAAAEGEPSLTESAEPGEAPAPPPPPGSGKSAPAQVSANPSAAPDPGQIDRLIAASRERSGGVDQGDEPRRIL
jgi:hypothetical protein